MTESARYSSETPDNDDWRDNAMCRDAPELFHAPSSFERKFERVSREKLAKEICRVCPVQTTCGAYALESRQEFGIWGGMTERERRIVLDSRGT